MHAVCHLSCARARARNYCAILGVWFPGCPLFRGNFVLESAVGSVALVRCPESRSVRFSEVV